MRKCLIVMIICCCLWGVRNPNVLSQVWTQNINETYKKPDNRIWGDIYSWVFSSSEFGKSYALVIGIGDYDRDWNKLEAPYYDAVRVRDFLIEDDGFDYVVTLTNDAATKQNINKLMEETFPALLQQNDRFFFYFSGHGTQRVRGNIPFGYLVMQNCGFKSYGDMITMDDIQRWDNLLNDTRHILFVLDCCFSGLAGQQRKSPMTEKKLTRLSQYAHYLITAGTENEESVASLQKWRGSLFTDAFLRAVSGRADLSSQDFEADGVVSLKELMKYIGDRIDAESVELKQKNRLSKGIKMSPQVSELQSNNAGEFFFITRDIKNQKVGNVPDRALARGWPVQTKGLFRSECTTLSGDDVKSMIKNKGFFDRWDNPNGSGFANQFVEQDRHGDKIVIDHATGLIWQKGGSNEYMSFEEARQWLDNLNRDGYAGF